MLARHDMLILIDRSHLHSLLLFLSNAPATTEIYTLSLHDALPISPGAGSRRGSRQMSGMPEEKRRGRLKNGNPPGDFAKAPRCGAKRSEERRVGKECRSRWSADH